MVYAVDLNKYNHEYRAINKRNVNLPLFQNSLWFTWTIIPHVGYKGYSA